MTPLLTIIVVVFLVGILIPKRPSDSSRVSGSSVRLPYFVFILSLASSPVIGVLIDASSNPDGSMAMFLQYLWVGIAMSLPLSLLTARLFGQANLPLYWNYLESFGGHSRALITYSWGFATALAVVGGLAIALTT